MSHFCTFSCRNSFNIWNKDYRIFDGVATQLSVNTPEPNNDNITLNFYPLGTGGKNDENIK